MSQEIIIEGSSEEIAQKIARFPGQIIRAILVVEDDSNGHGVSPAPGTSEDAWTKDFRRWAASHKRIDQIADDSRASLYQERLG